MLIGTEDAILVFMVALLSSLITEMLKERILIHAFTSTVSVCDGKKKHCFNNLATNAEIGIRWDSSSTCFCGCDVNFMLKLGLEQHRIYDFSDLGSDGNLSLDGGVFAVGIGFSY